jgi:hypothetical protein
LVCRWIQHSHREQVVAVGSNRLGDIELERQLAAFVLAESVAVQPHLAEIVDCPKAQERAAAAGPDRVGLEAMPIPEHAVLAGKHLLNDARHGRCDGVGARSAPPALRAPDIAGVGGDRPGAVEGVHDGWSA